MLIGVLALQGAVEPHLKKLLQLGANPVLVRRPEHLNGLSGIILPGGESTTMLHLLKLNQLWDSLLTWTQSKPTWGICAGTILLAKKVSVPEQTSFQVLNISVVRNAYGRQNESFIAALDPETEGVFIRAPKITSVGEEVRVLFRYNEEPVMVEERNLLASTFHPELSESNKLHRYFLEKCSHG